jgi:hypothetical protein
VSDDVTPPTDTPTDAPDTDTAAVESGPGREAAKYRRQLRDTEAKAATLSNRLEAMQRREVERLAAADLAAPADLWLAGLELADLLTDDGDVDEAKVREAAARVLMDRPTWKRPEPPPAFDGGVRQSAPTQAGWQDVLLGGRRRR